ncbi:MAG: hypothetical protein HOQ24_05825 [Mycobacteriaceae bacterium]|nr:hypothetical protein [Mycobacteriaceae bacterium]
MNTSETDPASAEAMEHEPDFAEEHRSVTHADEHPAGEELESDESTPEGISGMDP